MTTSMDTVIDRLFKRLAATYGSAWTSQWAGTPMNDVKSAWMYELDGYVNHLSAIAYALDNLPERCPNVIQFKHLCRAAPSAPPVPRIEPPKASPEIVAKVLAGMSAPSNDQYSIYGMKAWAYRLRDKDVADPRSVTQTVRKMYREVVEAGAT